MEKNNSDLTVSDVVKMARGTKYKVQVHLPHRTDFFLKDKSGKNGNGSILVLRDNQNNSNWSVSERKYKEGKGGYYDLIKSKLTREEAYNLAKQKISKNSGKMEYGGTAFSSESGEMIGGENQSSMYKRGGHVSKGEMVWKKLSSAERIKFLLENFTPEITPRSQEILVSKPYNFLPKNVKIKFEAKYANVENYGEGGGTGVSSETGTPIGGENQSSMYKRGGKTSETVKVSELKKGMIVYPIHGSYAGKKGNVVKIMPDNKTVEVVFKHKVGNDYAKFMGNELTTNLKHVKGGKMEWGGTAESSETGTPIGGENQSSMFGKGGSTSSFEYTIGGL